jgi:hypothetical protein
VVAVILLATAAAAGVVVFAPWFAGLGMVVVAAATWCIWLERHPH